MGFERERVDGEGGRHGRVPPGQQAVVVGGGLAGIAAATVLAERGVRVTVIEREPVLGGRVSAWIERLPDGTPYQMERGFHAFFRQYYNLRALLGRVDPRLERLLPLRDYPLLGPNGHVESFADLPKRAPFNVAALVRRTSTMRLRDLIRVDVRAALAMLQFDPVETYARWDTTTARAYLDSLRFPPHARRMLFDVFSHSFFNPEEHMSAAELLMLFHFYFMGNPEGLVFDVLADSFSTAFWDPMRAYLESREVSFRLATPARSLEREGARWRVRVEGGEPIEADVVVLALPVRSLQAVVAASPRLDDPAWRRRVESLDLTWPFVVWRLWLDRPTRGDRAPFAGTAGLGRLDNISCYHLFEEESRAWARRTGGSVVELHAYAVEPGFDEGALRRELNATLEQLYPETAGAGVIHERWLVRQDCPSFGTGADALRPGVETPFRGVALAGDCLKTSFPSALMERAAATGFLAANALMRAHDVRPEPVWSVPRRGLLHDPLRLGARTGIG